MAAHRHLARHLPAICRHKPRAHARRSGCRSLWHGVHLHAHRLAVCTQRDGIAYAFRFVHAFKGPAARRVFRADAGIQEDAAGAIAVYGGPFCVFRHGRYTGARPRNGKRTVCCAQRAARGGIGLHLPARNLHGRRLKRIAIVRGNIQCTRLYCHILNCADAICAGRRELGARAVNGNISIAVQGKPAVCILPALDFDDAVLHHNAALRSPDSVIPLRDVQGYGAAAQHGAGRQHNGGSHTRPRPFSARHAPRPLPAPRGRDNARPHRRL